MPIIKVAKVTIYPNGRYNTDTSTQRSSSFVSGSARLPAQKDAANKGVIIPNNVAIPVTVKVEPNELFASCGLPNNWRNISGTAAMHTGIIRVKIKFILFFSVTPNPSNTPDAMPSG